MNAVKGRILKKLKTIPQQLPYHRHPLPSEHDHHRHHQNKENLDPAAAHGTKRERREPDEDHHFPPDPDPDPDPDPSSFRRPRLDSSTLFDPALLAAFHHALADYHRARDASILLSRGPYDPLSRFDLRCPPGGAGAVVVYTTSLRGVRRTFDDCDRVRRLLRGLRVRFYERDVAADSRLREELRRVMGGRAVPPHVFVRGRYVGGADDVVALHEAGELVAMLEGMPRSGEEEGPCGECGGMLFAVCGDCGGGRKLYREEEGRGGGGGERVECSSCNENGLVACRSCSG